MKKIKDIFHTWKDHTRNPQAYGCQSMYKLISIKLKLQSKMSYKYPVKTIKNNDLKVIDKSRTFRVN